MIDTATAGTLYSTNNLLNKNQALNSYSYQDSSTSTRQESFQLQTDTVSLSYNIESSAVYNQSLTFEGTVGDGFDLLRGLVLNMFEEQGLDSRIETDNATVDLSVITPAEAQELIADDGYFGVEKTSERIFNFAVGISGGDPSRLDAIKEGVEQGFQEALDAFGGWLPEISYETFDAVMEKLDNWADTD